jgi:hypothetical protein
MQQKVARPQSFFRENLVSLSAKIDGNTGNLREN